MRKSIWAVLIACILFVGFTPFLFTGCTSSGKLYTGEEVAKLCGSDLKYTNDYEVAGVPCQWLILSPSTTDPHFTEMVFYVFDSKKDAKKAFEDSSVLFSDLEEEGKDYKKGWLANVYDASIEQYIYVSNNLIITVDTKCYSEWPTNIDAGIIQEPDLDVWRWEDSYRREVIDLMRNTF